MSLDQDRQYIIGTAGHIDHGKTALVKALTGVDTDRLPEEKARGITIDIGFAHLTNNVTIIDVPGHERLIKNMVAGVSTIDLVLFVVAADDGVMPQSREHLDIIRLLDIRHGLLVITKCDLVEPDWLEMVEDDVRGLVTGSAFESAPLLRTSTQDGTGIEELKSLVFETLNDIPARIDLEVYRQPIDRIFSAKGFGTVITGTVLGGKLNVGDTVTVQPAGLEARVRGLQSHDADVEQVEAGFRSAVNLAGPDIEELQRGMVLTQPGVYQPADVLNCRIKMLATTAANLKNNQRVRLHIHTSEVFARIILPEHSKLEPGQSAWCQFRLESSLHASYQDRFILRQYSPQRTLGGGTILQVNPFRYKKRLLSTFKENLERCESEENAPKVLAAFDRLDGRPLDMWQIKVATNIPLNDLQKLLKAMVGQTELRQLKISGKTRYISREQIGVGTERIAAVLEKYHASYPGRPGMKEPEIVGTLEKRYLPDVVRTALRAATHEKALLEEAGYYRIKSFEPKLRGADADILQKLEHQFQESGFGPPTVKEVMATYELNQKRFKELIHLLRQDQKIFYVDETLFFHISVQEQVKTVLKTWFTKSDTITVPQFKELTGTTRKHSIPLLEFLDKVGVTERDGDVRRAGEKLPAD